LLRANVLFLVALGYEIFTLAASSYLGALAPIAGIVLSSLIAFFVPFLRRRDVFLISGFVATVTTIEELPSMGMMPEFIRSTFEITNRFVPESSQKIPYNNMFSWFINDSALLYPTWVVISFSLTFFVSLLTTSSAFWFMRMQHFYERVGNTYPFGGLVEKKSKLFLEIPRLFYSTYISIIMTTIASTILAVIYTTSINANVAHMRHFTAVNLKWLHSIQPQPTLFNVSTIFSCLLMLSFIATRAFILPKFEGWQSKGRYKCG